MKAGHYEIQGETIAKFEFFENGYNPYSRYLDVDKVDIVLRKKTDKNCMKVIQDGKKGSSIIIHGKFSNWMNFLI